MYLASRDIVGAMHASSVVVVVALIGVPLIARQRRVFGPAANGWARLIRAGVYGGLWLLLLVGRDLSRFAGARFAGHTSHAERVNSAVTGSVVLFVLITAYGIGILWLTSRRSSTKAATLAFGAGLGVVNGLVVYALTPFGSFLHVGPWLAPFYYLVLFLATLGAPCLAGRLAGDRTPEEDGPAESTAARISQGLRAGLCTGGIAALLIALLTIPTMVHFPDKVALVWANPNPHVRHGGTFEMQMSVGDGAQKYLVLLFLSPFLAAGLGAAGSELRRQTYAGGEPVSGREPVSDTAY
jgi:hypothetical protein